MSGEPDGVGGCVAANVAATMADGGRGGWPARPNGGQRRRHLHQTELADVTGTASLSLLPGVTTAAEWLDIFAAIIERSQRSGGGSMVATSQPAGRADVAAAAWRQLDRSQTA